MKERPILFSAPMVRAILGGTKTQTRRAIKPQPPPEFCTGDVAAITNGKRWSISKMPERMAWHPDPHPGILCPFGVPGTQLWVRETFAIVPRTAYRCSVGVHQTLRPDDDHDAAIYRAGWERSNGGFRWRPSIHMPRWASRITLEVTDVRVERLQDISEADAQAEGIERRGEEWRNYGDPMAPCIRPRTSYATLWASINGPGSWDANPWVWVVSFKRVKP